VAVSRSRDQLDEHERARSRALVESVRTDDQLRAPCRPIVERTVPDLTVRDPLALHTVASLVLAGRRREVAIDAACRRRWLTPG
jgi:hypothetical protein